MCVVLSSCSVPCRYSAPVPGMIRLEQPTQGTSLAPMQSVDPVRMQLRMQQAEMGRTQHKRRRSDDVVSQVRNPFDNCTDGGDFNFYTHAPQAPAPQGLGPLHESVDDSTFADVRFPPPLQLGTNSIIPFHLVSILSQPLFKVPRLE